MKDEGGNLTIKIYENNNFIHIEISDTGIGIDNKIKTKIYDPFFTTKENGTGLGLWIANKQMKKLNGYLYCEKRINDGTNFIIVLPIKQEK
ncbi:Sensor histidine kinase RcsC [bioreactor metagenome]|uniref:Sensor histidine kinase RcsC n=1 Tax=bioreactor metagenome TaxID=1076179 RepID=A0A645JA94_9ZZZZ